MFKLNPIATNCNFSSASFYPTIVGSFYNLSCEPFTFTSSFYTTRDHTQLIQRNDLKSRSTPKKNLVRNEPQKIPPELFAASNAFIQDLDFYDHNRALHRHVLRQRERHAPRRDRYRSGQIATAVTSKNENATIGRTKAQNPRFSAQKKGNIQRHETLTDRSLQAFLPAIAVRTWDEIRHRYNLKKAAQVGTRSLQITIKPLQKAARSTQLTDYQARSFWQCPQPPPDLPSRIPQGAASLQEGGAA